MDEGVAQVRRLRGLSHCLELPARILKLAKADGEVFAFLEDGRSVKVSDLGGERATKQ